MKKLTKSKANKMIVGICSGLAEYYCADVNLVRLITIFLGLAIPQAAVIAYIVAIFLIPDENK